MQHKQGEERNQMFMFSLESAIAADSFVRVVDVFVDSIDLKSFGVAHVECHDFADNFIDHREKRI